MNDWREVPGFPAYEVSRDGVVRRRLAAKTARSGNVLTAWIERNGYFRVALRHESKTTNVWVHRIVCWAFHGDPPTPSHEAAHDDGVKTNNRASNLIWKTHAENAADRIRLGENAVGEDHPASKLSRAEAILIKFGRRSFGDANALADRFGVRRQTIYDIRQGRAWKHLKRDDGAISQIRSGI